VPRSWISAAFAIVLACASGAAGVSRVVGSGVHAGLGPDLDHDAALISRTRDAGDGRLAPARQPSTPHAASALLSGTSDLPARLFQRLTFSAVASSAFESASPAARSSRGPPASTTRS
jgi:hypothetical protein